MADGDRQPPQAYDTLSPAGVGVTATNQVSPGTIPEILDTGDRDLIDQAFDQIEEAGDYDALARYVESLPDLPTLAWSVQASSPAGVGSPGSQSFRSIHTTPESSPATPLSWGSARLSSGARTPLSQGSARLLTAAGVGGDGDGGGRRGPRIMRRGGGGVLVVLVVLAVAVLVVVVLVVAAAVVVAVAVVVVGVVDDDDDEPPFHL